MPDVGELVPTTDGRWMTYAPKRCPAGHELGPGRAFVGHVACQGHGGGHTTWTCGECDQVVYGPVLAPHCSVLVGPAAVRISNRSSSS